MSALRGESHFNLAPDYTPCPSDHHYVPSRRSLGRLGVLHRLTQQVLPGWPTRCALEYMPTLRHRRQRALACCTRRGHSRISAHDGLEIALLLLHPSVSTTPVFEHPRRAGLSVIMRQGRRGGLLRAADLLCSHLSHRLSYSRANFGMRPGSETHCSDLSDSFVA